MSDDRINCELCGLDCSMQISASHLRVAHQMTTKEYRALGYQTLSPARLEQLRKSPVGSGENPGVRGKYGPEHWNWKGGHTSNSDGYRVIYRNGRRMTEHRAVAEDMLGRSLTSDEAVHHIDGNRQNNDPSNLQVMTRAEHDKIKDSNKRRFHTGPDCEEAAHLLRSHGWSTAKISRALRVNYHTAQRWIDSD